MDPIACLLTAEEAYFEDQLEDAIHHLDNYRHWRRLGGSPGIIDHRHSDEFASHLGAKVAFKLVNKNLLTSWEL